MCENQVTEINLVELFKDHQFTIILTVGDLIKWMEDNDIEVTKEKLSFMVKSRVLEDVYYALDNQVASELEHIANEKINIDKLHLINENDVWVCDDEDCSNLMDRRKNEDLFFEVPEKYSLGKKPNIAVCESCWVKKGYAQIYYGYRALVDDGIIKE